MTPPAPTRPLYIGSEIYRHSTYGVSHPLHIPRVTTCTDLVRAMHWLPDDQFVTAPLATRADVERFHLPAYVDALHRAETTQSVSAEDRETYRIGAENNPVYPEIYRRPMTSAGGVMLACRLTLQAGASQSGPPGASVVHCPGGGTHHGRPARASGFCYLNDPVLGILTWLDPSPSNPSPSNPSPSNTGPSHPGLDNIVYLDIDAHHGDGVQDAFHADPRVLTISIHEAGRWPFTGAANDRAAGHARNLPVPPGFNDTEMRHLMQHAVLPLIEARRPQAIFLQCGADALEEDPLAKLSLSNNAHWEVVQALRTRAPRLVVTGGGGYNPYTVGRCWAGVWAILNDIPIPPRTTPEAEAVLRALTYNRAAGRNPPDHWFTTIQDQPREGPVRDEIRRLAGLTLHQRIPA